MCKDNSIVNSIVKISSIRMFSVSKGSNDRSKIDVSIWDIIGYLLVTV